MWEQLYEKIDGLYERMVEDRRYLHQHPELSFHEKETAKYIENRYDELGIPYKSNIGGYGIVATLEGGKPGKTIALRADFDALPIQEENDVPYKSKVDGVMHACGHDGHTASLLAVAEAALQFKEELPGTLVFLHQPAEEYAPGGAKPMIEEGALNGVDAVFGTHLWASTPLNKIETTKGPFMAGADRFTVTFKGKGGHGALPQQTKDPVVMAGQAIVELQQVVSRRINPLQPAVLSIGKIEGGNAFNVIPDTTSLTGTVRILDKEVQDEVIDEMHKILKGITISYDADYELDYVKGYPPVVNHAKEAEYYLENAEEIPGVIGYEEVDPIMGGEDFAYYLEERPGAFFFTGAQIEGHAYPHHHPKFDFDERALSTAAKALIHGYKKYQEDHK
ncbi:M20 metallopeptidase family protein [Alkalibacillus haloalkaliphilus]|uniref:M20 metallopeptidase family protein n=1 Tax=Alkalibacillus haloalkaliphilus TaxID=94136 RepID=UPI002936BFC0|nr:M20 family metallopeptidase [Alkalibacillus haloalkaliphilus]MDV2583438.1 M20 family metallopeptidase [Alkalibacillus haloalkaliphilus]